MKEGRGNGRIKNKKVEAERKQQRRERDKGQQWRRKNRCEKSESTCEGETK